ncbi:DUF4133 domain-containing protein [Runella limosa]|uniref:DUF4133 domain-containing protein n=1 Tax=Runella limosa TaxID=370978 RepID=UPI00041CE275|nr:DUF4133 domain-containing protein [Runella limosa]
METLPTKVIKGADDEIEFKGFKGRYFYQLAFTILGIVLAVFLLYMFGSNSLLIIAVAAVTAVFSYTKIKLDMGKNGKYGHIHSKHQAPESIIINEPFYKLVK